MDSIFDPRRPYTDEETFRFTPEQTFRRAITTLGSRVFQTKIPIGRKCAQVNRRGVRDLQKMEADREVLYI